eukprot:gene16504-5044_t
MNVCDHRGYTPLLHACKQCKVDVLQILVNLGGEFACMSDDGKTPLHLLAAAPTQSLALAMLDTLVGKHEFWNLLWCRDDQGNTPLHVAASCGYEEVVEMILRNEKIYRPPTRVPIVDMTNVHGATSLHLAVHQFRIQMSGGSEELMCGAFRTMNNLVRFGTNLNARDGKGNTVVHLCVKYDVT